MMIGGVTRGKGLALGVAMLCATLAAGCGSEKVAPDAETETEWQFQRLAGPMTMNSDGRAVFANILLDGDTLFATYQTAPPDTLNTDKNLHMRTYSRSLEALEDPKIVIDVHSPVTIDGVEVLDFDGDLGDHKLILMDGAIYFVSILKGNEQAAVLKFDKQFEALAGPLYIGEDNPKVEAHLDMGFCGDGHHVYAQFFHQNESDDSSDWGASIYQVSKDLELKNQAIIYPDGGTFVTGTSCVALKAGQMGVDEDRLQIFSTNLDYGNAQRVGIQTFAADMKLKYIPDSRKDIIEEALDVYFPTGPSFNEKHQLWVVGYTMENAEGEHGSKDKSVELGPSFIQIFDVDWKPLETITLNDGEVAFRVMTQTEGDDIYVVYDEMDKYGAATSSRARIERYGISKGTSSN